MRDNRSVQLIGKQLALVPYEAKFVPKYHEWMTDPFLLQMTASEPLSLEEEYEMQTSWREDPKKCTFIVLVKDNTATEDGKLAGDSNGDDEEISRMAGDVNLFLSFEERVAFNQEIPVDSNADIMTESSPATGEESQTQTLVAEIDIMIAEPLYRGKGFGKEAVLMMLWYGSTVLGIKKFFAKIHKDNAPSIKLFSR